MSVKNAAFITIENIINDTIFLTYEETVTNVSINSDYFLLYIPKLTTLEKTNYILLK